MSSFFSSDGSFSLQFAIIFVVIFLVLAAGVLLIRRFTGQGMSLSNKTPPRGRQPRLGIVDIYELDRQRQLILLRRDNVEHLLLVGGPNDVVVERNITRGINARLPLDETSYDEPPEPAPETSMASQADPRANLSAPAVVPAYPPAAPYLEPSFEMPVVVVPPPPGSEAAPPVMARPLDLSPPPAFAPDFREQGLRAPEASAPVRPRESQLARVIRRAPPSLVNLVPAALAERVRLTDREPQPSPVQVPPVPAAAFPPAPIPDARVASPVTPPTARAIDAAILSDMARQLEEALRRPAAAVRPAAPVPPAAPDPVASEPEQDAAEVVSETHPHQEPASTPSHEAHGIDPIAAAMAATAQEPEPPVAERQADDALFADDATSTEDPPVEPAETQSEYREPVFIEPDAAEPAMTVPPAEEAQIHQEPLAQEEPVAREEPVAQEEPVAHEAAIVPEKAVVHAAVADAPAIEEPPIEEPSPRAAEAEIAPVSAPEPAKPVETPPAPASKPAAPPNPFSVEEIEAEFARLLGRPLDRKQ